MALDQYGMVERRRNISLTELEKAERQLAEQMRAAGIQQEARSGIQGGFTNDRQRVLGQEADQARSDIETEYQSEVDILKEIDRRTKEAEDEAKSNKIGSMVTKGLALAGGIALSVATAGAATPLLATLATGAGIGSAAGGLASGMLGYEDLQSADVSRLMNGLGMMQDGMKAEDYARMLSMPNGNRIINKGL